MSVRPVNQCLQRWVFPHRHRAVLPWTQPLPQRIGLVRSISDRKPEQPRIPTESEVRTKRYRVTGSRPKSSKGPPVRKPTLARLEKPTITLPVTDSHSSTSEDGSPKELLPYHILRTPSNKLPVYRETKRGGNMELTKIRKVIGDLSALKEDVQRALELPAEKVMINHLTRQVTVKGFRKVDVETFLISKNF